MSQNQETSQQEVPVKQPAKNKKLEELRARIKRKFLVKSSG